MDKQMDGRTGQPKNIMILLTRSGGKDIIKKITSNLNKQGLLPNTATIKYRHFTESIFAMVLLRHSHQQSDGYIQHSEPSAAVVVGHHFHPMPVY